MVNLLIARHGNTFDKGDTILRVGRGTDLPLSNSGHAQAVRLGEYLKAQYANIDKVFVSELQRTQQTANIALEHIKPTPDIIINSQFNEVDYGPDEGKPEADVQSRVGLKALDAWDKDAIVPAGWDVVPADIAKQWIEFAAFCETLPLGSTVLVVTSNGVARFAHRIIDANHSPRQKLKTCGLGCFQYSPRHGWRELFWNLL